MKTICVALLGAAPMLVFAQTAPAPTTTPAPAKTAAPVRPRTKVKAVKTSSVQAIRIPEAAVKVSDGRYRYVDPAGKAWLYNETPFGVSRVPESAAPSQNAMKTPAPEAETAKAAPQGHVTATAKGDMIVFHKTTPFGATSWTKNKNELTDDERRIWDDQQPKRNQ